MLAQSIGGKSEILLCADAAIGAGIVVEQDPRVAALPPNAKPPSVAAAAKAPADDPDARYRRLLAGAGEGLRPGDFAGGEFDDDEPP